MISPSEVQALDDRAFLRVTGRFARCALLVTLLLGCTPPQNINAPVFAQRAPPTGHPTYLETIRYIDDGLRYVDPTSAFFIAPDGNMCFRGVQNVRETILDYTYNSDWCFPPNAVSQVDLFSAIGRGQQLTLFCKHSAPQCIREIGYGNRTADRATVSIVPSQQEKAAVEHLVYLMGGSLGDNEPFK